MRNSRSAAKGVQYTVFQTSCLSDIVWPISCFAACLSANAGRLIDIHASMVRTFRGWETSAFSIIIALDGGNMKSDEVDDPRREFLIRALSTGLFSSGFVATSALAQSFFGGKPTKLPPGKSIYRISGEASVNGQTATLDTRINPGDTIKTGPDSELIFVVNSQSMILRSNGHLVTSFCNASMRVTSSAACGAFSRR